MVKFKRHILKQLGELLLEKEIITEEELKEALEIQKKQRRGLLGQILIERKYVTERDILTVLSAQYGFPYLPLSNYSISPELLKLVPENVAKQYYVLPVERIGNILSVVMADPLNRAAIDDIGYLTGCKVEVFITTALEITKALAQYYPRHLPSTKEDLAVPAGQKVDEEPAVREQPGSPEQGSEPS